MSKLHSDSGNTITIITVTDTHYLVLLAALVTSIEENHHTGEPIEFHVVANGVMEKDRVKLNKSVSSCKTRIIWHSMQDVIPTSLRLPRDKSSYPINIYMRLLFPWFLGKQLTRVLYLDCDMIVLKDISELFHTDLGGFPVGACRDPKIQTFDNKWGGIRNYKELGLNGKSLYFNSGLLLIDCAKWNDMAITQKVIDCVAANKKYLNYPDQYGLNVVLADNWLNIDNRWNSFSVLEDISDPYLIHFTERKPIYRSYSNNLAAQEHFLYYLRKTHWANFKPITEVARITKKVLNIVKKF